MLRERTIRAGGREDGGFRRAHRTKKAPRREIRVAPGWKRVLRPDERQGRTESIECDTPRSLRRCEPDQVPRDCLNSADSSEVPLAACAVKLTECTRPHQPGGGRACSSSWAPETAYEAGAAPRRCRIPRASHRRAGVPASRWIPFSASRPAPRAHHIPPSDRSSRSGASFGLFHRRGHPPAFDQKVDKRAERCVSRRSPRAPSRVP
jgi:hypothetical protein